MYRVHDKLLHDETLYKWAQGEALHTNATFISSVEHCVHFQYNGVDCMCIEGDFIEPQSTA